MKINASHFLPSELAKYIGNGFIVEKHPTDNLYIYGYSPHSSRRVWDDVNIHLRGLIIDDLGNIIARGFPKFFTFKSYLSRNSIWASENRIIHLPDEPYRIYEKLDGTLAILYWINDKPFLSTQRSFSSRKALKATEILHTKYSHLFDKLERGKTYLFEVFSKETKVVISYKDTDEIYLLGILDNETGKDVPLQDLGFPLVKEYTQQFELVKDLNQLQSLNIPDVEGLVIVYESGLRVKIKFPWYKEQHTYNEQVIAYSRAIYSITNKIKRKWGIKPNPLSKLKVWKALSELGDISEIEKKIPEAMYYFGVESWLEDMKEQYYLEFERVKVGNPGYNDYDIKELLLKSDDEEFIVAYKNNGNHHDSVMWKFINRIEETFD